MARPKNTVPSYSSHKASGRARCVWTDGTGTRREKLLPGLFGSNESKTAYASLVATLAVSSTPEAHQTVSVAEALLEYINFIGSSTDNDNEFQFCKNTLRPVRELFAQIKASEFGPRKLEAVRKTWIDKGLTRQGVNRRAALVVRAWKWLASREMVPVTTFEALRTLGGLRAGKTSAPEAEPRGPVADDVVAQTLEHMAGHTKAIVKLLWLTGARPSEILRLTLAQLDTSRDDIWFIRPAFHKTSHKGKIRSIALGPKCIEILREHLETRGDIGEHDPVFSPAAEQQDRHWRMRLARKSKVQPSQVSRKKRKPERQPEQWYSANALALAVKRAAKRAGVQPWYCYAMRHSAATKLREKFGIEAAKSVLGHANLSQTEHYARLSETLAADIAKQVG